MPQRQRRRRRRRKLEPKFLVRRAVLFVLFLMIAGFIIWLAFFRKPAGESGNPPSQEPVSQAGAKTSTSPSRSSLWQETPSSATPVSSTTQPTASAAPWNLLLVNASTPLVDGFVPELDSIAGDWQVDRRIAEPLTKMINAAREDGIDLMICSAYRTVEKQTELFESRKNNYMSQGMDEDGAIAATLNLTSRPGTSEHHTGLAVDIVTPTYQNLDEGYADTQAAKWLVENAARFGFILRYPKDKKNITQVSFEPWHYRYVGEEHAETIMEAGICLEEYIYGRSGGGSEDSKPEDEEPA